MRELQTLFPLIFHKGSELGN